MKTMDMSIKTLHGQFLEGKLSLTKLIMSLRDRAKSKDHQGIFLSLLPQKTLLDHAQNLQRELSENPGAYLQKPLLGIPFAIQDNIDLQGITTTAGSVDLKSEPSRSATAIELLLDAGAIPLGKTNMDVFGLALTGGHSGYSMPKAYQGSQPCGGGSFGAALAVERELVSFALCCDPDGASAVSASMAGCLCYKASQGLISTFGTITYSPSLSSMALLGKNHEDMKTISQILWKHDPSDPFSKNILAFPQEKSRLFPRKLAVPLFSQLDFQGMNEGRDQWQDMLGHWEAQGVEIVPIDFRPFFGLSKALLEGPWAAERWGTLGPYFQDQPKSLSPSLIEILIQGKGMEGKKVFEALLELKTVAQQIESLKEHLDGFLLPTIPRPMTHKEVQKDLAQGQKILGTYQRFVSLLGFCSIHIPFRNYTGGIPWGFSLMSYSTMDPILLDWALGFFQYGHINRTDIAVVGAHLKGMPLNHQLLERNGQYIRQDNTSEKYKMYLIDEQGAPKPGLKRVAQGHSFPLEIWSMPNDEIPSFLALIPPPLGLGKLELSDGSLVLGFVCSTEENHADISAYGGWRNYLNSKKKKMSKES